MSPVETLYAARKLLAQVRADREKRDATSA
jgi:hypothetical protein